MSRGLKVPDVDVRGLFWEKRTSAVAICIKLTESIQEIRKSSCLTIDILEPKFQTCMCSTHERGLAHAEGFKEVFCKEMQGRHVASMFPTAQKGIASKYNHRSIGGNKCNGFPFQKSELQKKWRGFATVPNSLQTQELVQVVADCAIEDCKGQDWDAIALPGGEGGARVESLSWTS